MKLNFISFHFASSNFFARNHHSPLTSRSCFLCANTHIRKELAHKFKVNRISEEFFFFFGRGEQDGREWRSVFSFGIYSVATPPFYSFGNDTSPPHHLCNCYQSGKETILPQLATTNNNLKRLTTKKCNKES